MPRASPDTYTHWNSLVESSEALTFLLEMMKTYVTDGLCGERSFAAGWDISGTPKVYSWTKVEAVELLQGYGFKHCDLYPDLYLHGTPAIGFVKINTMITDYDSTVLSLVASSPDLRTGPVSGAVLHRLQDFPVVADIFWYGEHLLLAEELRTWVSKITSPAPLKRLSYEF